MIATKSDMFELGRKQAGLFLENEVVFCEILVTCYCPRSILLSVYNRLVKTGKLVPIEDMLLDQKQDAWNTAKEIAKGRLGRKALIEVVKALIALEYFLNL